MSREVMNYPSPADVLLKMCQGPDKTELSEEPAYRVTATAKEIQEIFRTKIEDKIAEAVRNVGIEVVDKEGLMAALTEDKQRYDEAYKKGYRACEKLLDKAIQILNETDSPLPCVEMFGDSCPDFCDNKFNEPQEECWKDCWKKYLSERVEKDD